MGIRSSQILVATEPETDSMTFENSFPEDILIDILSFVSAKDLLNNCVVACREWKDLIDGHAIWKRKCVREGKAIPPYVFDKIPPNYYRKIYQCNPFGRNLLKNPCGETQFSGYFLIHGGDGWAVENPPKGADPVPKEVGSQSCFATSYQVSSARQLIYLTLVEGIPEEVMDGLKPEIVISEWYAARFDCGSIYRLCVQLMDGDENALDTFEFEHREEQWTGKEWSKVTHTFRNYPPGVRIIAFEHSGEDTQFWAGNYGSKMTGGYVKFNFT